MDYKTNRGGIVTPCKEPCPMKLVKGVCMSCRRTKDEIKNWRQMSQEQRKSVMRDLETRSVE